MYWCHLSISDRNVRSSSFIACGTQQYRRNLSTHDYRLVWAQTAAHRPDPEWWMPLLNPLDNSFWTPLVTNSITKRSNNIVATITFAITDHNGSLIHTTIIIFCLATRQKQSIKINHLNNHKHVLQCADITSPNDFANESLKVVGSRARAHVRAI